MTRLLPLLALVALPHVAVAQSPAYTRADTLRGSITAERAWWDVSFHDLNVRISPSDSTIRGTNRIDYRVVAPSRELQVDLQQPMLVDSVTQDGRALAVRRDGNAHFVALASAQPVGSRQSITVHFRGRPRVAANAPWDGGFVWAADSLGRPWIATAVQGLGASAWWPTKDTQADEPDSQRVAITVPKGMVHVGNGRLRSTGQQRDGSMTYEWFVQNPINNYDVAVNAGSYAHFSDFYQGESGTLTLDYWPLDYNEAAARRQFSQVKPMLACFERWLGPFPWYADGFKLVETPHLGMEHQSAIAYGNRYLNGYRGRDLSGTGQGLGWDFIIIHESAHEWFGNSITAADIADMWVHESFTAYAENLYVECQSGPRAGATYVIGTRGSIQNDRPVTGVFGVQREGSGDMYYKGANMLHTIRQLVGDDERWRGILRGMNATFRHRVVTGRQVREYLSAQSGIDLSRVFVQYLETTQIPVLEYGVSDAGLRYRWTNVVPGFDMRVRVSLGAAGSRLLRPGESWSTEPVRVRAADVRVDENFYVTSRLVP